MAWMFTEQLVTFWILMGEMDFLFVFCLLLFCACIVGYCVISVSEPAEINNP